MLLLLLSSPRNRRQRRASLLLLAAVLLCILPVGASRPAGSECPHHIDCAKKGRHFCKPGSSHCGPCLSPLEENKEGHCVVKKKSHQHGEVIFYPDLDEEIDYLHSVIEKQVSEFKPTKKQTSHPAIDITSQRESAKKNKTDASKQKQKNQGHLSSEPLHVTAAAPLPEGSAVPNTNTPQPKVTGADGRIGPIVVPPPSNDRIIVIMISLFVAVGIVALILATVCFVKLQKESRLAKKVDYPAFGRAGVPAATATSTSMGDKTLAQNAQMYHYQHQKQQMISLGNHKPDQKGPESEATSDEEEVGGDFTVYECPGLAPTGEMEVKNPLFDDSTIHYQGNNK
ncbi:neural proliferation differentiation and control protein 1a [Mastacembelus armatus]|uniref:Neural proliferation, differentiation and control, 1a n=1 Tax=Mastacembelus armatus TaxID=205130 RepID=A0A3Q3LRZ8_9TELE|nr:neural proliferation differentiation and control protein 1-like [Mastacembelus armatus]